METTDEMTMARTAVAREAATLTIDRARFLLLAAALAASACGASDNAAGDGTPDASSATGGSSGAAATAGTSSGGSSGTGASADGGAVDSGSSGPACYGDTGAGVCPTDMSAECTFFCTSNAEGLSAVDLVRGGVAQDFISCVQEGTASLCTLATGYTCLEAALKGACPDSAADAPCSTIEGACAGSVNAITPAECHALLDGLTPTGRDMAVNCITTLPDGGIADGGAACQTPLWSCVVEGGLLF